MTDASADNNATSAHFKLLLSSKNFFFLEKLAKNDLRVVQDEITCFYIERGDFVLSDTIVDSVDIRYPQRSTAFNRFWNFGRNYDLENGNGQTLATVQAGFPTNQNKMHLMT